jgi:Spy/CpxP family protein refolding chaperone
MKSKLSVILLWILVFLLGGVSGAVSHYLYREHLKALTPGASPKPKDIVEGMALELKLDAQQKESLKAIMDQTRQRVHALNQQFRPQYEAVNKQYKPQFEAIRNETDDKIRQILRADQRMRFEEFLKKIKSAPPGPPRPQSPQ